MPRRGGSAPLGVKVVAEGVEDTATMDLLIEYGCDEAQGCYFSRPVPGEDLSPWLETSSFGMPRRLHSKAAAGGLPQGPSV